jgi:hypothetical protein
MPVSLRASDSRSSNLTAVSAVGMLWAPEKLVGQCEVYELTARIQDSALSSQIRCKITVVVR